MTKGLLAPIAFTSKAHVVEVLVFLIKYENYARLWGIPICANFQWPLVWW